MVNMAAHVVHLMLNVSSSMLVLIEISSSVTELNTQKKNLNLYEKVKKREHRHDREGSFIYKFSKRSVRVLLQVYKCCASRSLHWRKDNFTSEAPHIYPRQR
jgi:hypothetical protein